MSFSTDVKNELLEFWPKQNCCKESQAYGLMLFGSNFSERAISLKTENEAVAVHYNSVLKRVLNIECDMSLSDGGIYTVSVKSQSIPQIIKRFKSTTLSDLSLQHCQSCISAFLRGAFLSCGVVSDPKKEYHLEFVLKNENIAWELCKLLRSVNLDPKISERKGQNVVYLKESENIEDLLTLMNATSASLEIMNMKIYKEFRNNANRITNFETANIQKTAQSAAKHLEAIDRLEKAGKLELLPYELLEAALARREHYELPLSELGKLLGLSRSGIYHRLNKIINIANELGL